MLSLDREAVVGGSDLAAQGQHRLLWASPLLERHQEVLSLDREIAAIGGKHADRVPAEQPPKRHV